MNSSIIVSKSQVDKKPLVLLQIKALYDSISNEDELIIITPREGKLNELIKVLKYHQINYRGANKAHHTIDY
jgi:hypothetical protein